MIILLLAFLVIYGTARNQQYMNSQDNYSVEIIRYTISEDQSANFEKAYQQAGAYLRDSPYCQGYHVLHGEDEPNHYIVTIYWTSKEDHLSKFRKSPQFSNFLDLVKPYYNNIDEMKHYQATNIKWSKTNQDD